MGPGASAKSSGYRSSVFTVLGLAGMCQCGLFKVASGMVDFAK